MQLAHFGRLWFCLVAAVAGMMDFRDYATNDVPLYHFVDPGISPPSFIFAQGQFRPPYNLTQPHLEPFPGCDATYATLCSVQHSIRIVTRAREALCPELAAGGGRREAALNQINTGAFAAEGTSGFGLVALLPNGTIVADALRPELVGQRFDGYKASALVPQATLLDHIGWVTRWDGGFVPHFTTRLAKGPVNVLAGDAPVPASMYVEKCPTGERLGVAFGRKLLPAITLCNPQSNAQCAIQNVRRLVGVALVDCLNFQTAKQFEEFQYRMSYTGDSVVGPFYAYMTYLSDLGYPGPDPWFNPSPLTNTISTIITHQPLLVPATGRNLSFIPGAVASGIGPGIYVQYVLYSAAWAGGQWAKYPWSTPVLGQHTKVSLGIGVAWNGTGFALGGGFVHSPEIRKKAANCVVCRADHALPCTAVNAKYLAAHAFAELLTPTGKFDTLSDDEWFGSMHDGRISFPYNGTWPKGFYTFAFDYNGTCVTNGKDRQNVGLSASSLLGDDLHRSFKVVADNGGGWLPYVLDDGVERMAIVLKIAKFSRFFYVAVGFVKQQGDWHKDCTAHFSEPCSTVNAESLVGLANADVISAPKLANLSAVLQAIGTRSGLYHANATGDFQVYVYSEKWTCPSMTPLAACPKSIVSIWQRKLEAAGLVEGGTWVHLDATDGEEARAVFVFRTTWKQRATSEAEQVLLLVVYVDEDPGPPRCNVADPAGCPEHAVCTAQGRCACAFGFRANITVNASWCGALPPWATMSCTDVRGLDCSKSSGCTPCQEGFFCPEGQPLPCPAGQYCAEGSANPALCPSGTMSASSRAAGPGSCLPCSRGTFALRGGQTACEECWAGSSSDAGASMCELCPRGTYAEDKGRSQCTPCMGGKTTLNVASTSARACGCQEGTWFYAASPTEEGHCVSFFCGDGLECPGGNAEPMQGEGFHAGRPSYEHGMPGFFVACVSRGNCPRGRALGVCPAHRDAMACDLCEVGFSDDGQGGCTPCAEEGLGALLLALATTFAFISAPVHCFLHLRPATVFRASSLTLALTVALGVNALQVASAISHVEISWIEPMVTLREGLKWLTFDVKVLKVQCISTTNSPAFMYLMGLLGFPIYAVYVWLILLVAKKCCRKKVTFNDTVNVVGTAMFTLNTGLCLQVARAWQCETNPDGTTSAASAHSLLCYTSDGHRAMLGISVVGALVYLVAPLSLTLWVVWKFPHHIVKTDGLAFFERYRFLIARFRPERYWYCTIYMCKSILCAVLPALLVNDPPLVFMLFTLLIVGTFGFQCSVAPWRTTIANHLDAGISVGLLWFIVAGATLLPAPGKVGQEMLQRCMMTVCIVFLVALGSTILSKLYARLFPKKFYVVFLSHHKGAAAALSRWCKLMFQASTNRLIFLDSDEIDDLSLLFNVVAWETVNFVLLWTSQTVLRPWCAGEIVSAVERKVNTIVVLCEEVPRLTDEFIEQVGSTWTGPEIKCLVDLGITIKKIRQSYTILRSLPSMKFDRKEGEAAQQAAFSLILRKCCGLEVAGTMTRKLFSWISTHATRGGESTTGGAGGIAIVADTCAVETRTVCYILRIMLQKRMQVVVDVVEGTPQQTEEVLSVAKHLLVVLTKGCLKAPSIANCLVKSLTYSQLSTVPVNADKTFEFPGEDFWGALTNRLGEFNSVDFQGINIDNLFIAYKSMLKILALNLSPHASQLILDAEMSQMVNRLTADKKVGAGKPPITTPTPIAIDDQAIQAASPATGSAPQPVVVGADTEELPAASSAVAAAPAEDQAAMDLCSDYSC